MAQSSTLSHLSRCIFVTMSSLVPSPPANTPPVTTPPLLGLGLYQAPTTVPPRPILRLIVVSLLPHPPSVVVLSSLIAVSSPRSSVDCCFDPRTRLMLPPMASPSISAAAVVFRRYRPMPLSSYNAPLSAVDTDRCRLRRAAVAFVMPRACRCLPSSYDAAVVVVRCRRRRTLPSS